MARVYRILYTELSRFSSLFNLAMQANFFQEISAIKASLLCPRPTSYPNFLMPQHQSIPPQSPSTNSVDEPVSTASPTINICPNARNNLYSSTLLLNTQSINPSASSKSKWKVRAIQSIIHEEKANNHSIPFISITESWLKSYISDAQVNIPGYMVSRSDRGGRVRLGGGGGGRPAIFSY